MSNNAHSNFKPSSHKGADLGQILLLSSKNEKRKMKKKSKMKTCGELRCVIRLTMKGQAHSYFESLYLIM